MATRRFSFSSAKAGSARKTARTAATTALTSCSRFGLEPRRKRLVELRQQHDAVLVAARGMHHDPGAGRPAFVDRRVRHVGRAVGLLAGAHEHAMLERVAVIDRAFALEHVGDGLDSVVVMRPGAGAGRHRHHVHADFFRAHGLLGGAGAVNDALLAEVGLARLDHRKSLSRRHVGPPAVTGARLLHRQQFHIEHQGRVRRDDAASAPRAITKRRWHDQRALAADLHGGDALVPALDDAALTDRKVERLVAVNRRVEFLALLPVRVEPAGVVHDRGLARRRRAGALLHLDDGEAVGCGHAFSLLGVGGGEGNGKYKGQADSCYVVFHTGVTSFRLSRTPKHNPTLPWKKVTSYSSTMPPPIRLYEYLKSVSGRPKDISEVVFLTEYSDYFATRGELLHKIRKLVSAEFSLPTRDILVCGSAHVGYWPAPGLDDTDLSESGPALELHRA